MTDSQIEGTSLDVNVVYAVDGDTLKVELDGEKTNLRILALDTEESSRASNKPKTPWGIEAKKRAAEIFPEGSIATLEFPGTESVQECLQRYRDNYGRPLVYVYKDESDFQEIMIREGYSPYFTKYGYAHFSRHDNRYREAERQAQANGVGVWNQLEVNGEKMRDYDSLCAWWELRAEVIETFREIQNENGERVYDSRLDYDKLVDREGEHTTVFTELNSYRRVGPSHVVVHIGSQSQPFKLFLPNAAETDEGQRILSLLDRRYIPDSDGETVDSPLRSYGYVSGDIKLYRNEPEIEITSIDQITDRLPSGIE